MGLDWADNVQWSMDANVRRFIAEAPAVVVEQKNVGDIPHENFDAQNAHLEQMLAQLQSSQDEARKANQELTAELSKQREESRRREEEQRKEMERLRQNMRDAETQHQ